MQKKSLKRLDKKGKIIILVSVLSVLVLLWAVGRATGFYSGSFAAQIGDTFTNTVKLSPKYVPKPNCTNGKTRCQGSAHEECVNGNWKLKDICFSNETCSDTKGCVPKAPTCSSGMTQCLGNRAEVCTNGDWVLADLCTSTETCKSGSCVPNTPVSDTQGNGGGASGRPVYSLAKTDVSEGKYGAACAAKYPEASYVYGFTKSIFNGWSCKGYSKDGNTLMELGTVTVGSTVATCCGMPSNLRQVADSYCGSVIDQEDQNYIDELGYEMYCQPKADKSEQWLSDMCLAFEINANNKEYRTINIPTDGNCRTSNVVKGTNKVVKGLCCVRPK